MTAPNAGGDTIRAQLIEMLEGRVRTAARTTASELRRMADEIDRAADDPHVLDIPHQVGHIMAWGTANAAPYRIAAEAAALARELAS
ncbi:hypothetical protein ACT17_15210 [Mycolicibacterium conceptionense]|uniref:Uncharacterized protein n=1 Tax=Mycolicibacterium conceptionense TaxID=451644 RepID=A0A0J8U7X3_9MYCO|nr:hypothetical protein [Mycolicibacterium conceptionense]KMV17628.1 hypothetical protein ACT17_15210 [Mycolicibacterium conceptionense]